MKKTRLVALVALVEFIPLFHTGAGEAVGGIHGRNRLMGNSLLDIIVFGRSAGRNAAHRAAETVPAKLTLNHVAEFEAQLKAAGIETEAVSPKLLPDYRRK